MIVLCLPSYSSDSSAAKVFTHRLSEASSSIYEILLLHDDGGEFLSSLSAPRYCLINAITALNWQSLRDFSCSDSSYKGWGVTVPVVALSFRSVAANTVRTSPQCDDALSYGGFCVERWSLVDKLSYTWKSEGDSCIGVSGMTCISPDGSRCQSLCLEPDILTHQSEEKRSVST